MFFQINVRTSRVNGRIKSKKEYYVSLSQVLMSNELQNNFYFQKSVDFSIIKDCQLIITRST